MKYEKLDEIVEHTEKNYQERGFWRMAGTFGLDLISCAGYIACGSGIISQNPYITGNLNDSFLAAAYYFTARCLPLKKSEAAKITFGLATAAELGQYVGIFDPKGFDLKDIPAYALGIGIALGIDSIMDIKKKKNLKTKVEEND